MIFTEQINNIKNLDKTEMEKAMLRWDEIAKPVGSLGVLEDIVVKLAGIFSNSDVRLDKRAAIVMCADNGVLAQGVAQTPGEITAVMAGFIAQRRSSVCIMAKKANADIIAVDIGMFTRISEKGIIDKHIADGTKDMTKGPAMTIEQAEQAIQTGIELVKDCKAKGYKIIATGEMGIGNTTTSSAVASVLLDLSVEKVTGRGAGLSDVGLARKIDAIKRAIKINNPDETDAFDVLQKVGGFDIAGLCGVFLGGAIYGIPVVIDGFISAVSALIAARVSPKARDYMISSHVSAEPACKAVLESLQLSPIIHADMRLGEGTGAVAALPLIDMALAVYHDLMTYKDIGM
ncbi:MAG: nicotinate-nucleotide--dimethylbenzimidazole phosphoribosyltransferase [Clostridiaceae bacterium]|jgi:nicotinate-nucleotide--dimethylbenzimidazole phosphoribosyltransferase|nr:nicotinate-nucleotide--dimethylbenzimidazole phosphoribosyltransferase [Clostridiaceae bacterium]